MTLERPKSLITRTSALLVAFLWDLSPSMTGRAHQALVAAANTWLPTIGDTPAAKAKIEVAHVEYPGPAGPTKVTPFMPLLEAKTPALELNGDNTPLGAAYSELAPLMRTRIEEILNEEEVNLYAPLVFQISDGEGNDAWQAPREELNRFVEEEQALYHCLYLEGAADVDSFREQAPDGAQLLEIEATDLDAVFKAISRSVNVAATGDPNQSLGNSIF